MPYYYLAATLPMLSLEGPSPFAFDGLRARCNEQFSKHDRAALDELAEPGAGDADHPFVIAWRGRERALRGAIARLRAARLQRDAGPALEPDAVPDPTLQRRVEEALGRGNPAERELALDRLRWELLEELAGYDPFRIEAVLVYVLKLQIVERWAAMDTEAGRKRADALVARQPDRKAAA